MSSDEARDEAEWRFPVTAYECPEDQATEVERFVAGAEWQAERDAERIAELEAEVERLNDALDAADVRYQMLGDWGERMKAEAERVAELEAGVERLRAPGRIAEAVAKVTPCSCSAQRARAEAAEAEVDRLRDRAEVDADHIAEGAIAVHEQARRAAEMRLAEWQAQFSSEHDLREAAEAKLAAVRALHFPVDDPIHPGPVCAHRHCRDDFGDQYVWPCPTGVALDGSGET